MGLEKKILTICEFGNSRSVGCAFLLKAKYHKDAIACGICSTSPETFDMLCNWADNIIITFAPIARDINEKYKNKVLIWDVGADRYWTPPSKELIDQYEQYYKNS